MIQLLLVRPGSTDFDDQGRIQGTLDIPLSDAGRQQASKTAEDLRVYLPSVLYSCAGNPAEETAATIAGALNLKVKCLEKLSNINLGLWQGMLVEEVRHKQPKVYKQWQEHPDLVQPPHGEMLSAVIERVDDTLEKLVRKHKAGTIALVAPEPLAAAIRHRIDGTQLGDLWRASSGCRFEVLRLEPDFAAAAVDRAKMTTATTDSQSVYIYRGSVVERH